MEDRKENKNRREDRIIQGIKKNKIPERKTKQERK